jgi:hypothetical protein
MKIRDIHIDSMEIEVIGNGPAAINISVEYIVIGEEEEYYNGGMMPPIHTMEVEYPPHFDNNIIRFPDAVIDSIMITSMDDPSRINKIQEYIELTHNFP